MASTTSTTTITQINQACSALQYVLLFTDYSGTITAPSDLYEQLGYACSALQQYSQPSSSYPAHIMSTLGSSTNRAVELLNSLSTDTRTQDDITGARKNFLITTLPKTIAMLARGLLGDCRPHLYQLSREYTYTEWEEAFTIARKCWEADPFRFGSFAGDKEGLVRNVIEGSSAGSRISDTDYIEVYGPARMALMTWIVRELGEQA